jgi:hypothetical protein
MLTRLHPERIAAATHVPKAGWDLTQLTNDELIAGTRRLVVRELQPGDAPRDWMNERTTSGSPAK